MNPRKTSVLRDKHPSSLVHVQAARCGYHYIEELALYMFGLNDLEREVGRLLLQGLVYREIGRRVYRSESTIKADAQRIFEKTHVKNRRAFERHIHALIESI